MKKANRLIHESSPYLQQHAYNPVDWFPWGAEALEKAQAENKPILVSIGYSTCHWCHVMERESFEDETVAAFMNEHFINIKVDREERPDIDAIYMEAVQLIQNGQGGWPLNCFLTPDGRPFYGGTYFPPPPAYRSASWMQVLKNLSTAYQTRKEDVETQANQLLHYIKQAQTAFSNQINIAEGETAFEPSILTETFGQLSESFDLDHGGFGGAPKFPGTMPLRFCLNYYLATQDTAARQQVLNSLDKMSMGGIYDHLGGGFARYTVDEKWLVPHFEKMLYDNALLVGLLADIYKLEQKTLYKERIEETLTWVEREMLSKEGGFYSALDADSEGEEGKFYVWSREEVETVLGADAPLFCAYYDLSEEGNWEGKNILNMPVDIDLFMQQQGIKDKEQLIAFLANCRAQLLAVRALRVRPGLDDKILLDWNAMMITAYCKAYQALGKEAYKERAVKALNFALECFKVEPSSLHLYHSYKDGQAKHHAFLDDYALLIEALIEVYGITLEEQYQKLAKEYTDFVNNEFLDHQDQLYFFTSAKQQDILLHKKIVYDGATPSGNATMVHNLQKIGLLLNERAYRLQAEQTLLNLKDNIEKYPQSFAKWALALFIEIYPVQTIAVMGEGRTAALQQLRAQLLFNTFVLPPDAKTLASVKMPAEQPETTIIICKDYTCSLPIYSVEEALKQLEGNNLTV